MLRYCANLKAIRYEPTSFNRIVADKSHRVIAALVNGSPDLKTVREIGLKKVDYFHKRFLTNFNLQKRIPIVTYFVFFYQNAITETKQVEPLTLMVSTKSAHLLPENSSEAFNGFYCTWKPVKFRWKHFNHV